jgi:hypothetical protein
MGPQQAGLSLRPGLPHAVALPDDTTSFVLSFLGIDLASTSLGAAIVGSLGLVSAASATLAFLPPAAYLPPA